MARPYRRQPRARRGFTMMELIAVIVILGLAAGIAAPSLRGWGMGAKLRDATQEFVSATRWARAEAVAKATTMRLELDTAENAYVVLRHENGEFVDATGEFGRATLLPSGFRLELVRGGTEGSAIDFHADLRVTPAVVRITTPTGQSNEIACDYPAGQFAIVTPAGGTR